jgi:RNA polymerase sigma-70 factor (ECF subfamily)
MYSAGQAIADPEPNLPQRQVRPPLAGGSATHSSLPAQDQLERWITAVAEASDREAFACLFRHFAPRVKGYLVRSGSSPELAEELAQETMVVMWRRAASFDPGRAALSTWIFTIARNLRIDHHRRSPATQGLGGGDHAGAGAGPDADWNADALPADAHVAPEDRAIATQRARGVQEAMARLPADQALVLRMSFFEEHPHARIAEALGLPLGTVKSRIRLAVNQLRKSLDRFGT